MIRSILMASSLLLVSVVAAAAQSVGGSVTRPRTCVEGLHEYRRIEDVPAPHDTVRMSFPNIRLSSPDEVLPFLKTQAAASGATGFVAVTRTVTDSSSLRSIIPVFVARDTARVRIACTRAPDTLVARDRR